MYVYLYMYTRVYIFPFLLDIYNFMWSDPFLLKVEQFSARLVQWSTAAILVITEAIFEFYWEKILCKGYILRVGLN
jgi:hypothetical protein